MTMNLKYRRALFWDIPEGSIEQALVESDEWVVNRVFEYGTLNDIFEVIDLYGESRVKAVLSQSKMGRVTRAMAYLLFDLEESHVA
jgi:hypothetical protein